MSLRPGLMGLESRALDADRDPPNLRRYPSVPAADDIERPCYACLEESTHEIRTRASLSPSGWVWLDVCDHCDREAS